MKKLTPFLICLLAVFVGALFVFKYIGVTEPLLYYAQFENTQEAAPEDNGEEAANTYASSTIKDILNTVTVPAYYNCVDEDKINKTRDQGELGACWAFAANTALESRLLPAEKWDFSEDHMIYNNGFTTDETGGGDFYMAVAYLSAWKGPVPEEQDPYNDGETNPNASVVKHLQETVFLDDGDFETIKKMVYTYGAVESSIYIAIDEGQYIDETYYDRDNYSYCYDGSQEANHEIVIIGWDDDYSADNFKTGASSDGAFICLNSWGSEFGNNGIFYVSYDDICIGKTAEVYTGIEDSSNYDNIYQYDEHGWVGRMGFDESTAFFANVYTANGNETLKAVSFYATDDDTTYSVYVCRNFSSPDDLLTGRTLCAQGAFSYAGYYTVKLDKSIDLSAGDRYAVIVEIDTPLSQHPVAIEMDAGDDRTGEIVFEGKESYISLNGRTWENTQSESMCNVCLKAFTVDR